MKVDVYKVTKEGRAMYIDGMGNVYAPNPAGLDGLGKFSVGGMFSSIGNIFAKKDGGSAVGNTLRSVFGKKDGGSTAGNAIRAITGGKSPQAAIAQSAGQGATVTRQQIEVQPRATPQQAANGGGGGNSSGVNLKLVVIGGVVLIGTLGGFMAYNARKEKGK